MGSPFKLKEKSRIKGINSRPNQIEVNVNLGEFKHMFLVMELGELDCKFLLNGVPKTKLGEDEIICILYNQLCALNYVHTAGLIHRNV